ncbi:Outer membrane lipoprotein OmlA [Rubellimicrobium mesophilum DSM 19309]|uniref:Outer membrane lipoprotein OmlA n=1 Tax=Rubellimicrobium mesophilum DSM 19309 TaxID=442562 RepID=A0A017HPZ0_9RHOB|nr:outer membrane protein assembly factor BamE [Rubellimicrobium mesophilum]EYD76233.1 Outer membrane lipoprotein OmlA [Rubellimicrobium mesophilum DSM 19309]
MRKGLAGVVAVSLLLGACAPIYRNHGYVPPETALSSLQVGVDTRDSVVASLGRPTTTGVLGDQSFYYVQSRFRNFAFLPPEEVNRQVLALSFLPDGRLGNVERFGLERGRVVQLSRASRARSSPTAPSSTSSSATWAGSTRGASSARSDASLVRNEQAKHSANYLSGVAVAVGCLGSLIPALSSDGGPRVLSVVVSGIRFGLSLAPHPIARRDLRRLVPRPLFR